MKQLFLLSFLWLKASSCASTSPASSVVTSTTTESISSTTTIEESSTTTASTTTTSTTTTSTTTTTELVLMCIAGYTLEEDGNCYKFVNAAVDQPTAQMACQADGANLASIRNAQQQAIVQALAGGATTWIGIIRIVTGPCPGVVDSCFGTIDNNQPLGYSNWTPGEPVNGGSDGEPCVVINVNMPDGTWDDVSCTFAGFREYSYVCMIAPMAG